MKGMNLAMILWKPMTHAACQQPNMADLVENSPLTDDKQSFLPSNCLVLLTNTTDRKNSSVKIFSFYHKNTHANK